MEPPCPEKVYLCISGAGRQGGGARQLSCSACVASWEYLLGCWGKDAGLDEPPLIGSCQALICFVSGIVLATDDAV